MRRLITLACAMLATTAALAAFEGTVQMKMATPQASGTGVAKVGARGARVEMTMNVPEMKQMGGTGTMSMVMLIKASEPDNVYMINDAQKKYSVVDARKGREMAARQADKRKYKVEKLGRDTVAGFACQVARLTEVGGTQVVELCATNALSDQSWFKAATRGGEADVIESLHAAGIEGFPVRMIVKDNPGAAPSMSFELVSAKAESIPASTFEVPAGYTKSAMMIPGGALSPEQQNQLQGAMDKMTPEQRKMMEQMMKQQGH